MTTNDITNKARRIVEDTVEPYRWPDEEMHEHLQSALRRLAVLAPQTRYIPGSPSIVDYVELPDSLDDDLPVHEKYGEPLALYIAYLCYLNDATDTVNANRAAACLTRAEGMMV